MLVCECGTKQDLKEEDKFPKFLRYLKLLIFHYKSYITCNTFLIIRFIHKDLDDLKGVFAKNERGVSAYGVK